MAASSPSSGAPPQRNTRGSGGPCWRRNNSLSTPARCRVHALVGVLEDPERAVYAGRNDVVGIMLREAAPCTLLVYARRGTDTGCFFFTVACN